MSSAARVKKRDYKCGNFPLVLVLLLLAAAGAGGQHDSDNLLYDAQPRIQTRDGHLIFVTAADRNITFRSTGSGRVVVDGNDLGAIMTSAKQSVADLQRIKDEEIVSMRQSIQELRDQLSNYRQVVSRLGDVEAATRQLSTQLLSGSNGTSLSEVVNTQSDLSRRIRQQKNRIDTIKRLLERNECSSSPCRNGGTCEDRYNTFDCECPPNWTGRLCDLDVNECGEFAGTPFGCQNGATCVNSQGGYSCQCAADWFGIHCTERHDDCSSASHQALCVHGTCVNQARVQAGQPRFTCICDEGWTTDGRQPACVVDVDECSNGRSPCSQQPFVQCINQAGTFSCGPCPAGYTGNGFSCQDINECYLNNGGCSVAPYVQCTNTIGSRQCGQCPPGFQGNGEACTFVGLCNINNGGCSRMATCIENAAISTNYRECRCLPGYAGNGVGPEGCMYTGGGSASGSQPSVTRAVTDPCLANPCIRGTCVTLSANAFRCNCPLGYAGQVCQVDVDDCASRPCQNGGTCVDQTNSYACTCPASYSGDNCERAIDPCGAYLTAANGSLHYPSDPSVRYAHDRSCAWVITVAADKVINVTFTEFHLEDSSTCAFDFVQINDGATAGAHVLGRFCGSRLPRAGTILTTHNAVYIWFHSDSSVSNDGFQLSWTSVDPVCGGDLTTRDVGVIKSPGYPGQYPLSRDCVWTVRVPPGKRIQLAIATLQLEHHDNCDYDFLQVRDGVRDTDPVLATYCSTQNPASLLTSGSFARLYFHSDNSFTDYGFLITYSSLPGVPGCGGLMTNDHGSITSPDFPNVYEHGLECDWLIRAPPNERISIAFTDMHIEDSSRCRFDYLELFDGSDDSAPSFGRFCGRNMPPSRISTGNTFMIKFRADHSIAHGGFRITYEILCGGVFVQPSGVIHSPYYPDPYPSSRQCQYVLRQPPGRVLQLDFQAFDIEASIRNCRFDALEVRDGDRSDSPLIGRYCGADPPERILSTYNVLWMQFSTDDSVRNRGFLANYSTVDVACGGIHNESTGVIGSPNHPERYIHDATCRWILRPSPGRVVRLTFAAFSLEQHPRCEYDYVSVYDNTTTEDPSRLMGRFCGSRLPPVLTSSDNLVLVVFHSDSSVARDGFSIQFNTLDASSVCGGDYFTPVGALRSPSYPANYPHSRECTWRLQVATGRQIMLNISDFELEAHSDCRFDYLEIRNGAHQTSPLIGRYCGRMAPRLIPSHSNQLWLRFASDSSLSAKGFFLTWEGSLTGCGGELDASQGTIASPNYPMACTSGVQCSWRVTLNRGNRARVAFMDLDTSGSPPECRSGVQLYDGRSAQSRELRKVCGNQLPDPIISSGNELFIRFRCPNSYSSQRGFMLSYTTHCNTLSSGRRGSIETPNFPNPYPINRNCSYRITGPLGNRINMTFAVLHLEAGRGCQYDFVEVRDVGNRTSLGRYCGNQNTPPRLVSFSNVVEVRFVSDDSVAGNGFLLDWVASGCGEELRKPSGNFTSPNYPEAYPASLHCAWEIVAEPGHSIELVVEHYDMESSRNCVFDSLKVYSGRDTTAPLLTSLCNRRDAPLNVTSPNNRMYVQFISDNNRVGRGFSATYTTKMGGCGGSVGAPSGSLHSRNYPNQYLAGDDCTWLISVDPSHTVSLTLSNNFQMMPYRRNCSAAYLAVYDGPTEDSPLLLRACGSQAPANATFRSRSSQVLVRMVADNATAATGFQLNYATTCGALLYADEMGSIASATSQLERNCIWIIRARNLEDRVSFTFTFLHARPMSRNCTFEYVEVFEDDSSGVVSTIVNGTLSNRSSVGVSRGRFCSSMLPPTITSRGPALRVVARNYFRMLEFRAVFYEAATGCGGNLEALQGTFTSPEYPDSYPLQIECSWTISASPGNNVALSFRSFDLEESEYCNRDYVEVREGGSDGRLVGRYCGAQLPANLTAGGANRLWIKFRSDGQGTAPGFVASYILQHGSRLSGPRGEIATPLYPRNFNIPGKFEWTVTVDADSIVTLTFVEFFLDGLNPARCFNSLKLYDGADATASSLGQMCGSRLPVPSSVASTGNQLHLVFTSATFTYHGSRFLVRWNATQPPPPPGWQPPPALSGNGTDSICGGAIFVNETYSRELTSPNFPDNYPDHLSCHWTVTSPVGTIVIVHVVHMEMEGSRNSCYWDYLQFSEGYTTSGSVTPTAMLCSRSEERTSIRTAGNLLHLDFVTDYSVNMRGFKIHLEAECGGNLTSPSGVITSTYFPANYPSYLNCQWLVTVRPGRTIRALFTDFELEGSMPVCSSDYVVLRNGLSLSSPPLGGGKFCGSDIPARLPETSGNHLTVQFVSSPSSTFKGFRLTYAEVTLECGGIIYLNENNPTVTLTSPNYPSPYPLHSECEWRLVAPPRRRMRMDFLDHFDVPLSHDCRSDFVLVTDGGTGHAPLLANVCGHDTPASVQSSANTLFVRFSSADSHPSIGFRATVQMATCGGTVVAERGELTTPDYPHGYASGTDCQWLVRAPPGHFLIFSMQDLQTGLSPNCSTSDFVQIRDWNATGPVLGRYCGRNASASGAVHTADNVAYVRFRSVSSSILRGFRLRFESSVEVCGGEFDTPTGVLSSPDYPSPYPTHRQCVWEIRAARGRKVRLRFTRLELTESEMGYCSDSLSTSNCPFGGGGSDYPSNMVCGVKPPGFELTSSDSCMLVRFFSDSSATAAGFRADYDTELPADCGGELPPPSGNLSSPGFGMDTYAHGLMCRWTLDAGVGAGSVLIRVESFSLEDSHQCVFDGLQVRRGLDESGELMVSLCGSFTRPHVMVVPSGQVYFMLRTDSSVSSLGFNLTYEAQSCGGVIGELGGVISSPGYPTGYRDDQHCAWVITLQEGQQVQVTFEDLQLESNTNCTDGDYVLLRNGATLDSPVIGTYCGAVRPAPLRSQRHQLMVEFHSNVAITDRGFRIRLTPVSEGCGGVLHDESGQLSSPNYPGKYPSSTECEWSLETESGFFFNLTFVDRFDLEMRADCDNDFIEPFDWRVGAWQSLGRKCGREFPNGIHSKSNRFRLLFRTNEAIDGDGFKINWTKSCGGVFSDNEGSFTSPNYPQNYPDDLDCLYYLKTPPGHYMSLTFDPVFSTENSSTCMYDRLEVYAGNDTSTEPLLRQCGVDAPAPLSRLGPLTLRFISDYGINAAGFRVNYKVSECGGFLDTAGESGEIRSPTHPDVYHANMNCTWVIQAGYNQVIQLKFVYLDLEASWGTDCGYDRVAIHDGNSTSAPSLGRFCGRDVPSPASVKSSGSNITINFVTDESVHMGGFRITYRNTIGVLQGCGGIVVTSDTETPVVILSPDRNNDGSYEPNLDCTWIMVGHVFFNLRLTFQRFDLERPTDRSTCPWDYLEIRDGLRPTSPVIERLCGNDLPPAVTASSHWMRIRMVTDDTNNAAGFAATILMVQPDCGGVVNLTSADTVLVLTSPNYPSNYPSSRRCNWIVSNHDSSETMMLHVEDLQMESSEGCRKDFLLVTPSDTSTSYSPQESSRERGSRFCGDRPPANIYYSSMPLVEINFASDSAVTGRGFKMTISRASCNTTLETPYGRIQKMYENGSNATTVCNWLIRVANGSTITFNVNRFDLPQTRGACTDYFVEFRDGGSNASPLLDKMCNNAFRRNVFVSTQNQMLVSLMLAPFTSYLGFGGSYYSTNQGAGCGGNITNFGQTGEIVSPNYPGNYSREASCQWEVSSSVETVWLINFFVFDVQPNVGNCSANYVQLYDGAVASPDTLVTTLCAADNIGSYQTTGNSFIVKYVTDTSNNGTGFHLVYGSSRVVVAEAPVDEVAKSRTQP